MAKELSKQEAEEFELSRKVWSQIQRAQKEKYYEQWIKRAERIYKRYRDERDISSDSSNSKHFNIFYSNIQTLQPAIYSRTPKPQVERRYKDKDPIGRAASQILERALDYDIQSYDFDQAMNQCRDDYLIAGRSQVWLRYKPTYGPLLNDMGEQQLDEFGKPLQKVVYEEVICDFIHFKDFIHQPARTWDEVGWVARLTYLSKDELEERFGEVKANQSSLDFLPDDLDNQKNITDADIEDCKKASVWEFWDKKTKKVYWVSKGCQGFLDVKDDPLGLKNFFPCPRPLLGITTTQTCIPVPEFAQYQDQANELDEVTARISCLTTAIKVSGVYDASKEGLKRLLSEGAENQLIPEEDWPSFAQQGRLKGSVDFMPIGEIAETLMRLYDARERIKQEIYEITGIADIIRGSSSPSETATAQQIKGQFATLRLADRQRQMQRFVRDVIAIKGEIIAEHFEPETLAQMVGIDIMSPEAQQFFMPAIELLKNETLRNFRIDIETDSTIAIDEQQDKEARTEFLQAVTPFIQTAMGVIQSQPEYGPLMTEMLMFSVRGFKAGRSLEGSIESAMEAAQMKAQEAANQPPPPDPEAMKVEAQMQIAQFKAQSEAEKNQAKMAADQQKAMLEAEMKKLSHALEMQKAQFEAALEQEKLRGTLELQAEKVRSDMALKAYQAQDSTNLMTMKDLSADKPTAAMPPIVVNVDAKQPVRKIGTITRTPDGNSIVTVEDAPPAL